MTIAQTTDYDSTTQDSNNPEQYGTTMTVNLTHESTADSDIRTSTPSAEKIHQLNTVNSELNLSEREYDLNEKNTTTETGESGLNTDIKIINITDDSIHNYQLSSNDNSNIEQLSVFTLNNESTYLTDTDFSTEQTYTTTVSEITSHSESKEIETAQNTTYLDINGDVHVLNIPLEHEPKLDRNIRNSSTEKNIMFKAQHDLKLNLNEMNTKQYFNVNVMNHETHISVQSSLHGNARNTSKEEMSSVEMDDDALPTASSYSGLDKMEHRLAQDSLFLSSTSSKDKSEGNGFDTPEPREVEEAADYGLRMMNELIRVKEPELYRMGELNEREKAFPTLYDVLLLILFLSKCQPIDTFAVKTSSV